MAIRALFVPVAILGLALTASAQEAVIHVPGEFGNALATTRALAVGVVPSARAFDVIDADCDGNGEVDVFDFLCFQSLLAAGDPAADCDGSGVLDLLDSLCFHNAFAAGFAIPAAQGQPDWLLALAPGEWCGTNQRYLANLQGHGINPLDVVCAALGPCDNPADRNAAIPTVDTPIKTYRLSIHVFCDNGGSNCAATPADVAAAVGRLNADYAPWRIQFIYQSNFINNTKYRTLALSEEFAMKSAYANSPATRLNIYVVDTGGGNWGTFPWDSDSLGQQGGVIANGAGFVATTGFPSILTHEVGHCLGLWHTHHGVSEVPECGDCYEAAGRSPEEGDITGDKCSDTNPTPRNDGHCYDAPGTDICSGNPWGSTPFLNYMSYSYGTCPIEFTPQQAGRIHCWTTNTLTGWLDVPAPPAAPGTPTLTKLGAGQVRVSWADNSGNEDAFRVQRETKSGPNWINTLIVATVGPNTTSATNTPGAGTFRYRVQAFNGVGDSAWSAWTQIKN